MTGPGCWVCQWALLLMGTRVLWARGVCVCVCVPARLLCPWDSPGKNTGVGCHFLLQGIPPHPESTSMSPPSPALTGGVLPTVPPGKSRGLVGDAKEQESSGAGGTP